MQSNAVDTGIQSSLLTQMVSLLKTWRVTSKPGIHIFFQPPLSLFFFLTVNLLLWGAYWHLALSICICHRSFCPKNFQGHLRKRQIFLIFCPFLLMPCGNCDVNGTLLGWACSFWTVDQDAEIYFTCPADCRLYPSGEMVCAGSCSPHHIHLQHPCDSYGHLWCI